MSQGPMSWNALPCVVSTVAADVQVPLVVGASADMVIIRFDS